MANNVVGEKLQMLDAMGVNWQIMLRERHDNPCSRKEMAKMALEVDWSGR